MKYLQKDRVDGFSAEPVEQAPCVCPKREGNLSGEGEAGKDSGEMRPKKIDSGRRGGWSHGDVACGSKSQNEEECRDGGKRFPAVLPKIEGKKYQEEREGEEHASGKRGTDEAQNHDGGAEWE